MRVRVLAASCAFMATVTLGLAATADQIQAERMPPSCAEVYEQGQKLIASGKLKQAVQILQTCAQNMDCDEVDQQLCEEKQRHAVRATPSILLFVTGPHGDETDRFLVSIDGHPYEGLVTAAIAIDPGTHVLQISIGEQKSEPETVVIRQGQKKKKVEVTFARAQPTAPAQQPQPATQAIAPPRAKSAGLTSIQVGGIVTGVLGLAAIGVGAGLGGIALSKNDEATVLCPSRPDCSGNAQEAQSLVDEADSFGAGSTATIVVGAVAAAAGITMLIAGGSSDGDSQATLHLDAAPTHIGLRAQW